MHMSSGLSGEINRAHRSNACQQKGRAVCGVTPKSWVNLEGKEEALKMKRKEKTDVLAAAFCAKMGLAGLIALFLHDLIPTQAETCVVNYESGGSRIFNCEEGDHCCGEFCCAPKIRWWSVVSGFLCILTFLLGSYALYKLCCRPDRVVVLRPRSSRSNATNGFVMRESYDFPPPPRYADVPRNDLPPPPYPGQPSPEEEEHDTALPKDSGQIYTNNSENLELEEFVEDIQQDPPNFESINPAEETSEPPPPMEEIRDLNSEGDSGETQEASLTQKEVDGKERGAEEETMDVPPPHLSLDHPILDRQNNPQSVKKDTLPTQKPNEIWAAARHPDGRGNSNLSASVKSPEDEMIFEDVEDLETNCEIVDTDTTAPQPPQSQINIYSSSQEPE